MCMEKLPQEVSLDIFSRLPAECVLECKLVCKTWLTTLEDPSFAQMHLRRRKLLLLQQHEQLLGDSLIRGITTTNTSGDVFEVVFMCYTNCQLYYKKYGENDEQSYKTLTSIKILPPFNEEHENWYAMGGSCNGLICFYTYRYVDIDHPVYIWNPITREYIDLPRFKNGERDLKEPYGNVESGFGYQSTTNEYKVVCVYYPYHKPLGRVYVYTLGGGTGWRYKGKITYHLDCDVYSGGTLANGELYWFVRKTKQIVAFSLEDEEFRFIASPPLVEVSDNWDWDDRYHVLCSLRGFLCLVRNGDGWSSSHLDIWLLKKNSMSNSTDMKEQEQLNWSWSKEFTVAGVWGRLFVPLSLTGRGEFLLWHEGVDLFRYDPKTAILEELEDNINYNDKYALENSMAFPHICSFVSLKALGGQGVGEE